MSETKGNNLFPVFLKLEELNLLIVGGGRVGLEKLNAVLSNSPKARVTFVSDNFIPEIMQSVLAFPNVKLVKRRFKSSDLSGKDLVILALNNVTETGRIRKLARKRKILVNAADKPELCDFYLGAIVRKGDLKIAVSTNGKSPTLAKRLREVFEDVFPENIQGVLNNLETIRKKLRGDFAVKIKELNRITSVLARG
jgi:siroheme synthase-like protein